MKAAFKAFQQQFDGEFHFDDLHRKLFATDASVYRKLPLAVAFPKSVEGIQQLVRFANENNTTLVPRTAGTSLAGQCVGEGVIVDVSKHFTKTISVDRESSTVTVQPGVIRDELNDFLKTYQLFFGPNTSTSNRCMIGGMAGNNSSGTTSIKYGVTRDKVVCMKVVLADGSLATFAPLSKEEFLAKTKLQNKEGEVYRMLHDILSSEENKKSILEKFPKPEIHRRNTGYALDSLIDSEVYSQSDKKINICKLLCGSEGTLAFTTELTLSLDLLPPVETAMVVSHYANLADCLEDVLVAMKHDLYTCELIDDIILDCTKQNKKYEPYRFFVEGEPKVLLLLELRSNSKNSLDQMTAALLNDLMNSGRSYAAPVLHDDEILKAMELRKAGLGLLGNLIGDKKAVACIEDTAVALTDLPKFISEFSTLMKKFEQQAVYYAHAGAGELHLRPILNLKDSHDRAHFRAITTEVAALTKKYRGSFSGEHGDGIVRSEFLKFLIGDHNYELLRKVKQAFDPKGIFNPGKIIDPWKMDESLRYEADRVEPTIPTIMDFDESQGILRLAENCNGSGDCRKTAKASGTMCPSYHATKNEKDTTRGRANMLREVLTNNADPNKFNSIELKETFDLCLSCKACASECPSNVDISTVKAEFLYQFNKSNKVSRADKFFGKSSSYNKRASQFPGIANILIQSKLSRAIAKRLMGIASSRSIPIVATKSFTKRAQHLKLQRLSNKREVTLFVDEFTNYLEPEIAEDAVELLHRLGYSVHFIDNLDSARALISKGFLDEAKREIDKNVMHLKDRISEEMPLLGIEPSAILGFRDEYLKLANDREVAKKLSENTFLIEEFLATEMAKGNIDKSLFTSEEKEIKIHVHCHQKALSNQKVTFDILNFPQNYSPKIIPSGCCGMAGSFGFEKSHFDLSMQIGELKLFPTVRKADPNIIIAANGTSCRHQIKDGTQRIAVHPITILRNALLPQET